MGDLPVPNPNAENSIPETTGVSPAEKSAQLFGAGQGEAPVVSFGEDAMGMPWLKLSFAFYDDPVIATLSREDRFRLLELTRLGAAQGVCRWCAAPAQLVRTLCSRAAQLQPTLERMLHVVSVKDGYIEILHPLCRQMICDMAGSVLSARTSEANLSEAKEEPSRVSATPLPAAIAPAVEVKVSNPSIPWKDHLARYNGIVDRTGRGAPWEKINDGRQKLLKQRAKAEGLTLVEPGPFWDKVESVAGRLSEGRDWLTIEILIRVPQRGNPDHFQRASEGYYGEPETMGGGGRSVQKEDDGKARYDFDQERSARLLRQATINQKNAVPKEEISTYIENYRKGLRIVSNE